MATLWTECRQSVQHGSGLDALLAAARLECSCADAGGATAGLRQLTLATAQFYLGQRPRPDAETLNAAASLPAPPSPGRLAALEGIRFYALEPAGYAVAARRWLRDQTPGAVWVLGLRSMGSVLAPVVAAALSASGCPTRVSTLRPSGAPQDRKLELGARLRASLARWQGAFVIVDEGPGLSGSSFGGSVRGLRALGIGLQRIALLAQWAPDARQSAELSNPYAAQHWHQWRVYAAAPLPAPAGAVREISAGQWRQALGRHTGVAVWGQHERRKFLCEGGRTLAKFAGLGGYGEATLARARALDRAGWGPRLAEGGCGHGWIHYCRERTRPLRLPAPGWCEFAGRYMAWVAAEWRLGGPQPPSSALREMLSQNLERLVGREAPPEAPAGSWISLDGRMLAWEWGLTRRGYVKFDGTDHGDDPFFPGPADIAWDLAGLEIELGPCAGQAVRAAYARASGETAAALAPRLAWHRLAYAAFRTGFCLLAATRTAPPEQARFVRLASRYGRYLGGSPRVMTAAPLGGVS